MNLEPSSEPYPLKAFYAIISDAAFEVQSKVQAPDALVGMQFLAGMSAAAQGLFDVQLPIAKVCPVSLFICMIATTGERLTPIHTLVHRPLVEFDAERAAKFKAAEQKYEVELRPWQAIEAGLYRRLSKATGDSEAMEQLRNEHAAWMAKKPAKPRKRRIVRLKMSESAMMDALAGKGESIALLTDESETIFKSGAFDSSETFNKGWDGPEMLSWDRGNGVSVVVEQPRMTLAYKAHPKVLAEVHRRRGSILRDTGHFARYLFGYPASTQGMRYSSGFIPEMRSLPKFHAQMKALLDEYERQIDAGILERTVLSFSEDARRLWFSLQHQTEDMLKETGPLSDVRDFASKLMEIAGRVAALLHIFSEQQGDISCESLDRAMTLVEWHTHEFKRLFSPRSPMDALQKDVRTLERYLHQAFWCAGVASAPRNIVLRAGPLRPVVRLEAALDVLQMDGRIRIRVGDKRTRFIDLSIQYFGSLSGGGYLPMR